MNTQTFLLWIKCTYRHCALYHALCLLHKHVCRHFPFRNGTVQISHKPFYVESFKVGRCNEHTNKMDENTHPTHTSFVRSFNYSDVPLPSLFFTTWKHKPLNNVSSVSKVFMHSIVSIGSVGTNSIFNSIFEKSFFFYTRQFKHYIHCNKNHPIPK